ncbi:SpaA isopeptide-forming pilin-related protein, partial [Helcococcus kunzii]|uniref:SpaA isopeptide-forming pilin-related protein n=1 Tax=Helcococcus kunzii TaxID=40091 RepID=UPI0024AE6344
MRQTKKLFVFILLVSMLLSSTTLSTKVNAQAQSGIDTFAFRLFELNKVDEGNKKLENAEFEIYNENGQKVQFRTMKDKFREILNIHSPNLYVSYPFNIEYHSIFPLNGVLVHGNQYDPNFEVTFNEQVLDMLNEGDYSDKIVTDKNKIMIGLLPKKISEIKYNIFIENTKVNISFFNLKKGTFTLKEIKAPSGYIASEPKVITVEGATLADYITIINDSVQEAKELETKIRKDLKDYARLNDIKITEFNSSEEFEQDFHSSIENVRAKFHSPIKLDIINKLAPKEEKPKEEDQVLPEKPNHEDGIKPEEPGKEENAKPQVPEKEEEGIKPEEPGKEENAKPQVPEKEEEVQPEKPNQGEDAKPQVPGKEDEAKPEAPKQDEEAQPEVPNKDEEAQPEVPNKEDEAQPEVPNKEDEA